MKIAVMGKGGVGKTTIAGILARTLARAGHRVVALDADPNPNLGLALGLGYERTVSLDAAINRALRDREHGHGHDGDHTHKPVPPDQVLADVGVTAPDGVLLVQTGRIERPADGCLCCGSHGTTRRLFGELPHDDRIVIADLEAGLNDLLWARPGVDDTLLVVLQPSIKAFAVARRALTVAERLGVTRRIAVANRVTGEDDVALVTTEFPDVEVVIVPDDPAVVAADREGAAPMDTAREAPAVRAVARLATRLVEVGVEA